ncbi:MAG TPA: beta-ketoacyl-ACP synthase II [Armatimonadota bacterium]|jgi:3-oxoacyl-[acyl-carrier-protein] synthase II
MMRRVVVTGLGTVNPLGNTVEEFWSGLMEGRSGIDLVASFDTSCFDAKIAGEVKGFEASDYLDRKEARRMDRFVHFAVAASRMALADAGLEIGPEIADQVGVLIGSGIGGLKTFEDQTQVLLERGPGRVSPSFIPMMILNMPSGHVSILTGARGPNLSVATACATGNHAIGEAMRIVQHGDADVMICGGTEAAVTRTALAGFGNLKALSTRNDDPQAASRPFDRERDGFVVGEGAGILVIEELEFARARGAKVYAELVGYGMSGDAHHMVAPCPDGSGAARSMRNALRDARVQPTDVGYINAHGTSTHEGDLAETRAVKAVFGEFAPRVPVSSTKSMTGHLLGAAGGIETIATVLAIARHALPPTINLRNPDEELDLDYVPLTSRPCDARVALTNSFGFGGQNATLVVKALEL